MISFGFTGFVTDLRQSSELLYTQSELPYPGLCVFLAHALSPWPGLSPHSYSPGQNQCLKYHSDPLLEARLQKTKKTLHYSNHAWEQQELDTLSIALLEETRKQPIFSADSEVKHVGLIQLDSSNIMNRYKNPPGLRKATLARLFSYNRGCVCSVSINLLQQLFFLSIYCF